MSLLHHLQRGSSRTPLLEWSSYHPVLILCLEIYGQLSIPKHQFPTNFSSLVATCKDRIKYDPISTAPTRMSRCEKYPQYTPQPVPLRLGVLLLSSFNAKMRSLILMWGPCHLCLPSSTPLSISATIISGHQHFHKRQQPSILTFKTATLANYVIKPTPIQTQNNCVMIHK